MLKKEMFEIYKNFYPVKDIKGILYCDESCKVRKTKLTPSGTNADIKYNFFVLAGLFIEKK